MRVNRRVRVRNGGVGRMFEKKLDQSFYSSSPRSILFLPLLLRVVLVVATLALLDDVRLR